MTMPHAQWVQGNVWRLGSVTSLPYIPIDPCGSHLFPRFCRSRVGRQGNRYTLEEPTTPLYVDSFNHFKEKERKCIPHVALTISVHITRTLEFLRDRHCGPKSHPKVRACASLVALDLSYDIEWVVLGNAWLTDYSCLLKHTVETWLF